MFLFLCLLWHAGLATAASTILVLGDSLSAAHNLKIEQGWVALLDHKLAESHAGRWRVVNASISGETSSGGLARLPAALAQLDQLSGAILAAAAEGHAVADAQATLRTMAGVFGFWAAE